MHASTALLCLATGLLSLTSSTFATEIPDGGYITTQFDNGTQVYKSVTDTSLAPIIIHPGDVVTTSQPSAKFAARSSLAKRRVDCRGYQLDASGIDRAAVILAENVCGNGYQVNTPVDRTVRAEAIIEGMKVYYCVNAGGRSGNCDRNDVYYALGRMDAVCRRYEASWFGWPGSFELVGKARSDASVCEGGMGNTPFN